MMNSKDIPQADQSWAAAEKMLNRHFRNKRIMKWSLSVVIPAIMVGLTLMITHFNKSGESNNGKTMPVEQSVNQSDRISGSGQNISVDKNLNQINKTQTNNSGIRQQTSHSEISQKRSEEENRIRNQADVNYSSQKKTNYSGNLVSGSVALSTPKNKITSPGNINQSATKANSNSLNSATKKTKKNSTVDGTSVPVAGVGVNQDQSYPAYTGTSVNNEAITLLKPYRSNLQYEASIYSVQENKFPVPVKKSSYSHVVWEIGAYGGANYIQKNLSGNSEWNNYLMHRRNEEDAIIAPSIGLNVTANLKSLSISAGVEYSVYGEETNYYPYSNQLTIDDNSIWQTFTTNFVDTDTAYIWGNQRFFETVRQRSDSIFIFDQDTTEEYKYDEEIAKNNGVNRIYYVEIPIEVSYTLNKGRMGFGVTGGISPAFLTMERGYYLRQDGKGIESLEEIESFRKFLVNARVGVDIYYRAGARTKLMLRPLFKTNLNSVFEDDYGVKQKYYSTGVLFGVSYMLN